MSVPSVFFLFPFLHVGMAAGRECSEHDAAGSSGAGWAARNEVVEQVLQMARVGQESDQRRVPIGIGRRHAPPQR